MRKYPKKIQKMRGTRTCGYGRVGQHRKTGQRAGRGKTTQWKKSKRSFYLKQKELGFPDPDWIMGKTGFKRPQDMVRLSKVNAINVKDLDYSIENIAKKSADTYTINLNEINIQKLLGRGQINKKINVSVNKASKRAIEKIEAAGGKVTLLSESK
ncbi:MAG: 50S ribosomal protein L15 [Promethearchaeota archaeon]|nr:MAG: 50S ribosomal protein L15 [Candidatus Lokiarchaeota archaeon]TFG25076.1 MAG: 50S ribosomal protein L15 [Candidatus Lokiarchaeota archaeon]